MGVFELENFFACTAYDHNIGCVAWRQSLIQTLDPKEPEIMIHEFGITKYVRSTLEFRLIRTAEVLR